jgi:hypothetical protein
MVPQFDEFQAKPAGISRAGQPVRRTTGKIPEFPLEKPGPRPAAR